MELAQMYFPAIAPRSRRSTLPRLLYGVRPRVSGSPPKPPYQSAQAGLPERGFQNTDLTASLHNKIRITMQDAVFGTAFADS